MFTLPVVGSHGRTRRVRRHGAASGSPDRGSQPVEALPPVSSVSRATGPVEPTAVVVGPETSGPAPRPPPQPEDSRTVAPRRKDSFTEDADPVQVQKRLLKRVAYAETQTQRQLRLVSAAEDTGRRRVERAEASGLDSLLEDNCFAVEDLHGGQRGSIRLEESAARLEVERAERDAYSPIAMSQAVIEVFVVEAIFRGQVEKKEQSGMRGIFDQQRQARWRCVLGPIQRAARRFLAVRHKKRLERLRWEKQAVAALHQSRADIMAELVQIHRAVARSDLLQLALVCMRGVEADERASFQLLTVSMRELRQVTQQLADDEYKQREPIDAEGVFGSFDCCETAMRYALELQADLWWAAAGRVLRQQRYDTWPADSVEADVKHQYLSLFQAEYKQEAEQLSHTELSNRVALLQDHLLDGEVVFRDAIESCSDNSFPVEKRDTPFHRAITLCQQMLRARSGAVHVSEVRVIVTKRRALVAAVTVLESTEDYKRERLLREEDRILEHYTTVVLPEIERALLLEKTEVIGVAEGRARQMLQFEWSQEVAEAQRVLLASIDTIVDRHRKQTDLFCHIEIDVRRSIIEQERGPRDAMKWKFSWMLQLVEHVERVHFRSAGACARRIQQWVRAVFDCREGRTASLRWIHERLFLYWNDGLEVSRRHSKRLNSIRLIREHQSDSTVLLCGDVIASAEERTRGELEAEEEENWTDELGYVYMVLRATLMRITHDLREIKEPSNRQYIVAQWSLELADNLRGEFVHIHRAMSACTIQRGWKESIRQARLTRQRQLFQRITVSEMELRDRAAIETEELRVHQRMYPRYAIQSREQQHRVWLYKKERRDMLRLLCLIRGAAQLRILMAYSPWLFRVRHELVGTYNFVPQLLEQNERRKINMKHNHVIWEYAFECSEECPSFSASVLRLQRFARSLKYRNRLRNSVRGKLYQISVVAVETCREESAAEECVARSFIIEAFRRSYLEARQAEQWRWLRDEFRVGVVGVERRLALEFYERESLVTAEETDRLAEFFVERKNRRMVYQVLERVDRQRVVHAEIRSRVAVEVLLGNGWQRAHLCAREELERSKLIEDYGTSVALVITLLGVPSHQRALYHHWLTLCGEAFVKTTIRAWCNTTAAALPQDGIWTFSFRMQEAESKSRAYIEAIEEVSWQYGIEPIAARYSGMLDEGFAREHLELDEYQGRAAIAAASRGEDFDRSIHATDPNVVERFNRDRIRHSEISYFQDIYAAGMTERREIMEREHRERIERNVRERRNFASVVFSKVWRGKAAREKVDAKRVIERLFTSRYKAARLIQAMYRGYYERNYRCTLQRLRFAQQRYIDEVETRQYEVSAVSIVQRVFRRYNVWRVLSGAFDAMDV